MLINFERAQFSLYIHHHVLNEPEYSDIYSKCNRIKYYIAFFRRITLVVFGDLPNNKQENREVRMSQCEKEVRQSEEIKQQGDLRE